MYTIDKKIIEVINHLRGMGFVKTYADLEEIVGISRSRIWSVEKNGRHFSSEQIEQLCKVYDVDANYLIGVSEKMFRSKKK